MKPVITAMVICLALGSHAQNVGIGTSSPNANAKLDITATDKGLLIPRMDSVHRKSIPNTIGLLVYDSTTKSFWFNNGASWQNMDATGTGWSLTGNNAVDTSINFFGTINNTPLVFKVGNQPAGIIGLDSRNTGFGWQSLQSNSTGTYNTAFGSVAMNANTGGMNNVSVGSYALSQNKTGGSNTALGSFSLLQNVSGGANTAVGLNTLRNNVVNYNSAFGASALTENTTGTDNTALGNDAMKANVGGSANAAMGRGALEQNISGNSNIAIGVYALRANQGDFNTAVGESALYKNTSGTDNTAMGRQAMILNTAGSYNTAIGQNAMGNNIFGSNNTMLGYASDVTEKDLQNAVAIGANAKVDASNKIRLGDNNVTVVESNGVFNTVSDGRFKYNIQEDVKGLDFIMQLRPVTYQFDTKKQEEFTKGNISVAQLNNHAIPAAFDENNTVKRTGFIAQEVEAAAQKTQFDFDGVKIPGNDKQYYSLSYASFVVPLVKAVQEQQQTISTLKKQNELLVQQNELIMKRLEALEKK